MAGKPCREFPKESIHIQLGSGVLISVLPLLNSPQLKLTSKSQLIEAVLFLSERMHIEEPNQKFIIKLARLRSDLIIDRIQSGRSEQHDVHVTIDKKAVTFMDLLVKNYPDLFKNRSECAELLLYNIGRLCTTQEGIQHFAYRLDEVLMLHPAKSA